LPAKALSFRKIPLIAQQVVAAYRLDISTETEKMRHRQHYEFDGGPYESLTSRTNFAFFYCHIADRWLSVHTALRE